MRHDPLILNPGIHAFQQCCSRLFTLLLGLLICVACTAQAPNPSGHQWTQFVQVEGQPEPVPAEWLATSEGKFAHSIKIPNPVPKDSGYRPGMSSKQYFDHLCKTEAGQYIYKTVDNVEGFYFARPPKRPTDNDLMDRYALEAPDIERTFQLMRATLQERATIFIAPPFNSFKFIEEPNLNPIGEAPYLRASGYVARASEMKVEDAHTLRSNYGLVWRGIRRQSDRELAIAGSEWIVFDTATKEVLAVTRNYGLTGHTPNTPAGIWWLNAVSCPIFATKYRFPTSEKIYDFVSSVLKPIAMPR
jgi:hypothetical protein